MGKYTKLKGSLPTGFRADEDSGFRSRVNEIKTKWRKTSPDDLASLRAFYRLSRKDKEEEEIVFSEKKAVLRAAEELLIEAMDAQNLASVKDSDGTLFYTEYTPSVRTADSAAAEAWIRENKFEFLLSPQPARLASFLKERLLEGKEVPDCFDVSSFTVLKMKLSKGAQDGQQKGGDSSSEEEHPF